MIQSEIAVRVNHISKAYQLWNSPKEQLAYFFKKQFGTLSRLIGKKNERNGYRNFHALHDISFEIHKGDSLGIIGVNGSGKSTLLKIISGNLRPTTGQVEVDGKVVILDYSNGFNGEFTGRENVFIKATILGLNRKQIKERFAAIVEFAELGDFIDQPVRTYSSGMISRLGFAIVAHVDADIIITDEALAVGDVFFVQKCMQFIREFLKKGTFILVSHSTSDILSLCQTAIWLDKGSIQAMGLSEHVVKSYLHHAESGSLYSSHVSQYSGKKLQIENEESKNEIVTGLEDLSCNYSSVWWNKFRTREEDARIDNKRKINNISVPYLETNGIKTFGGAKIQKVDVLHEDGSIFSQMIGGEQMIVRIKAIAECELHSPILAFQLLDRLGQILFSSHSHFEVLRKPCLFKSGDFFSAQFTCVMPLLPSGEYVMRALIVTLNDKNEECLLDVLENSHVIYSTSCGARHGLVGIPMLSIKLKCQTALKDNCYA